MSEEINKNFKGLYDTSKTTFITDRTEPTHFYEPEVKTPRIKNISYSINFDKKELYKQIDDLQQRVEQLEKENKEIYETQKEYGCRLLDACDFIEQRIGNKDFDYIKLSMDEMVYLLNILNKGSDKE